MNININACMPNININISDLLHWEQQRITCMPNIYA